MFGQWDQIRSVMTCDLCMNGDSYGLIVNGMIKATDDGGEHGDWRLIRSRRLLGDP